MTEARMTEAEKKRILRERRQAKMAKGKATERLNTILSQGSSSKANVISVLDVPDTVKAEAIADDDLDPGMSIIDEISHNHAHDEPDIFNIEKSLSDIFQQNGMGFPSNFDPLSMTGDEGSMPNFNMGEQKSDSEIKYHREMIAYNLYQQKSLKYKFLLVRFLTILVNFFYHYNSPAYFFRASSGELPRIHITELASPSFFRYFLTAEVVLLSSYYFIASRKDLIKASGKENFLMKLLSMVSLVAPQIKNLEPILLQLLAYLGILGMFIEDMCLIIILFGFTIIYS